MNTKCVFAIVIAASILTNCSKRESLEQSENPNITLQEDEQRAKEQARKEEEEEKRKRALEAAEAAKRRAEEQSRLAQQQAEEEKRKRERAEQAQAKRAEQEKREAITRRATAAAARKALIGKTLGEVKTKDATYTNVKVEGANELALTIFHSNGAATINYPDLPSKLRTQVRYHEGDYQLAKEASKTLPTPPKITSAIAENGTSSTVNTSNSAVPADKLAKAKVLVDKFREQYQIKKGERAASQKALSQKQREVLDLESALRQKMTRNEDIANLKRERAALESMLLADAKIEGEVNLLLRKMAFSPLEYVELESMLADYENENNAYYALKGKIKVGKHKRSVKYHEVTKSRVKSPREEKVLANMEKALSAMEIEAAKQSASLQAFNSRLRDARGNVTRNRKR